MPKKKKKKENSKLFNGSLEERGLDIERCVTALEVITTRKGHSSMNPVCCKRWRSLKYFNGGFETFLHFFFCFWFCYPCDLIVIFSAASAISFSFFWCLSESLCNTIRYLSLSLVLSLHNPLFFQMIYDKWAKMSFTNSVPNNWGKKKNYSGSTFVCSSAS